MSVAISKRIQKVAQTSYFASAGGGDAGDVLEMSAYCVQGCPGRGVTIVWHPNRSACGKTSRR
jgi:hypothetical protein